MKNKFLFTAILIAGLTFVSVGTSRLYGQDPKGKTMMKDSVKYVCPHHPDMVSDKPGKCKCGMDLVAINKNKMSKSSDMKKGTMMKGSKDMKHDKMMKDSSMMKKGSM